ncbi:MAG: hypothetical protein AB7K04_09505 [Pseudorhodoplanes sp.]
MRPVPLALSLLVFAASAALAQSSGGKARQPPAPPPAKPYNPVAIKLPTPMNDADFEAFRKQVADAAQRKDRAALAKLVTAQGFFWETAKGDKAAKNKPGIDNLSAAMKLGAKQGFGWEMLAGYAGDPTAEPNPQRQGVLCAPADPTFDGKAFEQLAKDTGTDPAEWGYLTSEGVEAKASAQPNAATVEKLGLYFVRVLPPDGPPPAGQNELPPMKIVTPSGKTAFVRGDAIAPIGNDQICYVKDASGWKVTGFIGGDTP